MLTTDPNLRITTTEVLELDILQNLDNNSNDNNNNNNELDTKDIKVTTEEDEKNNSSIINRISFYIKNMKILKLGYNALEKTIINQKFEKFESNLANQYLTTTASATTMDLNDLTENSNTFDFFTKFRGHCYYYS